MKDTHTHLTRIEGSNYLLSTMGELFREKSNEDIIPVSWVKNKKYGYLGYNITINQKKTFKNAHVWMYTTFCGTIPQDFIINHIDLDKTNNYLTNLELTTYKGNTSHYLLSKNIRPYVIEFHDKVMNTTLTIRTFQDVMDFCKLKNRSAAQQLLKVGKWKHYIVRKRYLKGYNIN